MAAFIFIYISNRDLQLSLNLILSNQYLSRLTGDVGKLVGAAWKDLSETDKKVFACVDDVPLASAFGVANNKIYLAIC